MRCRCGNPHTHHSTIAEEWLCYRHALPHMPHIPVEQLDNWENAMRAPTPKVTAVEPPLEAEVIDIFPGARRPRHHHRPVHGLGKAA